jgi:DNA-binding transcriptional LysR family regulator
LSRTIRRLEQELGQSLFHHQGRRLVLTPFGQWAYAKARQILDETAAFSRGYPAQHLRVGASLTTLTTFLPAVIRQFRELAPTTELHIETGLSAEIFELVGSGRVEVGVVSDAQPRPYFRVIPLFTDPLWVLAPVNHPWPHRQTLTVPDLAEHPLILMTTRTLLRADLDALFRSYGITPDLRLEVDNVEVIQRMVAAGLGVTILPRSVCLEAVQQGGWVAFPLADAVPSKTAQTARISRTFGAITLHAELSSHASQWLDLCVEFSNRFREPRNDRESVSP